MPLHGLPRHDRCNPGAEPLKPTSFKYHRPATLKEALALLDAHGDDARPLAGGQSLVAMMNLRLARPSVLVDLNAVDELFGIRLDGEVLHIGAMTRQASILASTLVDQRAPLVSLALKHVGHFQTRSRGTIGGSLAHADPSAELALAMVTLGAKLRLQSVDNERVVDAREFFVDAMTTVVGSGEIVSEVMIPVESGAAIVAFREYSRREGDFAIVSAAAHKSQSEDTLLVGVGGVGAVPRFCRQLSIALSKAQFDADVAAELVRSELEQIEAISDLNADGAYRRHVASQFLLEVIREVLE
ncbi:FAD binding domain-containing protein [Bradyrhizobium elkanii]|uniref:FAD binding domain-containing protein n=1 Tax=Bradyrhizobium elkanii TaxID=29448 RepID=UPI0018BFAE95|nr:FAD binding domain-containing protein [Bradyrhizobium elkanii]QOZ19635.1 xanthine dehydrogenase family protein subunit M [Bradyrhizobium sp. CCBAU 21365]